MSIWEGEPNAKFKKRDNTLTLEEKFWSKVDKRDASECWLWLGSVDSHGYGQLYFKGNKIKVHRFSYIIHHGEIPKNKPNICHSCDNPPCANPEHLFACTKQENSDDIKNRGNHLIKDKYLRDGVIKGKNHSMNLTRVNKRLK